MVVLVHILTFGGVLTNRNILARHYLSKPRYVCTYALLDWLVFLPSFFVFSHLVYLNRLTAYGLG